MRHEVRVFFFLLFGSVRNYDLSGMPNDIVFLGWQIVDQNDVDD